jgi:hypothetical protein
MREERSEMHIELIARPGALLLLVALLVACQAAPTPDDALSETAAASTASASATSAISDATVAPEATAPPTPTYELIALPTEEPLMPVTPQPTIEMPPGLTPGPPLERATDTPVPTP